MDSREKNKVQMVNASSTSSYRQQQPDPLPCAKPCGSYANPATDNLCSRCYKDYLEKLEQVKLTVKTKKMKASSKVDIPSTNPFPHVLLKPTTKLLPTFQQRITDAIAVTKELDYWGSVAGAEECFAAPVSTRKSMHATSTDRKRVA